jgi:purine-binding chemotaxis protein CheW
MTGSPTATAEKKALELITFSLGDTLYGIDINKVLGINKILDITPVALAPDYIKGLLNLRGQIISIIDLGIKLGLLPSQTGKDGRIIIVSSNDEHIGLQVDQVFDVIVLAKNEMAPPPPNLGKVQGEFFEGVAKTETSLIGILKIDVVLQMTVKSCAS